MPTPPWILHALLATHLLAAAAWVGGMATMHWAVRPTVAAQIAEPPRRLALMAALLARFFRGVTLAIALLLASGAALVALEGGMAAQPLRVHLMTALGLLMTAVYALIRARWFPALQRSLAAGAVPAAAAALGSIRRAVSVNLALGVIVFVAAAGRYG